VLLGVAAQQWESRVVALGVTATAARYAEFRRCFTFFGKRPGDATEDDDASKWADFWGAGAPGHAGVGIAAAPGNSRAAATAAPGVPAQGGADSMRIVLRLERSRAAQDAPRRLGMAEPRDDEPGKQRRTGS